jgi:AbrB family looped-hinge helix DNA binding protein
MAISHAEMRVMTDSLPTKSAKIRALAKRGVERAEIARFLKLRYQHVRNVLEADRARSESHHDAAENKTLDWPMTAKVDSAGRVVIPAALRSVLGLREGDEVVLRLDDNGELRLITRAAALRRARDLYRRFAPEGESLADQVIADRRRDAEDESRGR